MQQHIFAPVRESNGDQYLETKAGSVAIFAFTWKQIQIKVADKFASCLVCHAILQYNSDSKLRLTSQ